MRRLRLESSVNHRFTVWYARLDRRNGYLAWGPVGVPFNRRRAKHWLIVLYVLWRDGKWPPARREGRGLL